MNRSNVVTISFLLVVSSVPAVQAQTLGVTVGPASQTASPAVAVKDLYWAFFHNVADLEREAQEAEKSGKDGKVIREYYKRKLKLTDVEHSALHTVASDCDAGTRAQDEAAKKVITTARGQLASQARASGGAVPPPPPELFQMQALRDGIVLAHIDQLKAAMGAAGFQKVDNFVNTAFAQRATSQTVPLPTHIRSLSPPSQTTRIKGTH